MAAATRTPFESARRVFVIEDVQTMNDQAANRLLKTLEEPPPFAHLMLLSDRREDVLATIASRCQQVRFDPLTARARSRAGCCAEGRAEEPSARWPARGWRWATRRRARSWRARRAGRCGSAAEGYARARSRARRRARRGWSCWRGQAAGASAGEQVQERWRRSSSWCRAGSADALSARRRRTRTGRAPARAHGRWTAGCALAELWLRDMLCVREGAPELVYAVDRIGELEPTRTRTARASARAGVELVRETRARLALNVSEELALEALAYGCRRSRKAEMGVGWGDWGGGPSDEGAAHLIRAALSLRLVRGSAPTVGLEREEAREQAVVGAVEVGGAGAEQTELRAARGQQLGLLARVGDVEGLHAVDPERAEALDARSTSSESRDVPEGVRPDGHAAGGVDRLDRLRDGRRLAQAKRGPALDQVAADQRADVVDLLLAQAARRWRARRAPLRPGADARSAVPAATRAEIAAFVELEALLAQGVGHAQGAPLAVGRGSPRGVAANAASVWSMQVAEDVQFARASARRRVVDERDLHRGDDAHAVTLAGRDGLGDAADRVVVGQRQQLHAGARRRAATTSAAASAPSEWVECDCRSKREAPSARSVCDRSVS